MSCKTRVILLSNLVYKKGYSRWPTYRLPKLQLASNRLLTCAACMAVKREQQVSRQSSIYVQFLRHKVSSSPVGSAASAARHSNVRKESRDTNKITQEEEMIIRVEGMQQKGHNDMRSRVSVPGDRMEWSQTHMCSLEIFYRQASLYERCNRYTLF